MPDPNETPNAKLAIISDVGFVYYRDGLCFECCVGVLALGGSLGWAHSQSKSY